MQNIIGLKSFTCFLGCLLLIWRREDLKALVAVNEGMVVILAHLGPLVATLSTSKQGEICNHPLEEVTRFLANDEWR